MGNSIDMCVTYLEIYAALFPFLLELNIFMEVSENVVCFIVSRVNFVKMSKLLNVDVFPSIVL